MKIWLDDERPAPEGWTLTRWPDETIELLKKGPVEAISLDHDLGDDNRGTGYDVLLWMESEVRVHKYVPPATIEVHSANPVARKRMQQAIDAINRQVKQNVE